MSINREKLERTVSELIQSTVIAVEQAQIIGLEREEGVILATRLTTQLETLRTLRSHFALKEYRK